MVEEGMSFKVQEHIFSLGFIILQVIPFVFCTCYEGNNIVLILIL